MPRVRRVIFQGLTGLSLLLCGVLVIFYVRSFWKADYAFRVSEVNWTHLTSSRGRVEGYWKTSNVRRFGPQRLYYSVRVPTDLALDPPFPASADPALHRRWAVGSWGLTVDRDASDVVRILVVPYWALVLGLGVAPVIRFGLWYRRTSRRRERLLAGCCVQCGYDLRASRERCPECGMVAVGRRSGRPRVSSGHAGGDG